MKKLTQIQFAPGAFDNFDGTQEELDALIEEIKNMFVNKTQEEIKAMSRPLDEESFNELPDEIKQSLIDDDEPTRTLQ